MGIAFGVIDRESYDKLNELYEDGIIEEKFYRELETAKSEKQLVEVILIHVNITSHLINKIWNCLSMKKWSGERGKSSDWTFFNRIQLCFWVKLLANGGIISRDVCQSEWFTDQQIINNIPELEDNQFILSIRTVRKYSNRTTYFVHPLFLNEVKDVN